MWVWGGKAQRIHSSSTFFGSLWCIISGFWAGHVFHLILTLFVYSPPPPKDCELPETWELCGTDLRIFSWTLPVPSHSWEGTQWYCQMNKDKKGKSAVGRVWPKSGGVVLAPFTHEWFDLGVTSSLSVSPSFATGEISLSLLHGAAAGYTRGTVSENALKF